MQHNFKSEQTLHANEALEVPFFDMSIQTENTNTLVKGIQSLILKTFPFWQKTNLTLSPCTDGKNIFKLINIIRLIN